MHIISLVFNAFNLSKISRGSPEKTPRHTRVPQRTVWEPLSYRNKQATYIYTYQIGNNSFHDKKLFIFIF